MMCGICGTVVDIKRNPKTFKGILIELMKLINNLLRCYAFLTGLNCDGYSVFVRPADVNDVLAPESQIP